MIADSVITIRAFELVLLLDAFQHIDLGLSVVRLFYVWLCNVVSFLC